ncbi:MAG: cysteine-rich CWC family protein [Anaerolineales bacterium]|nr:cysteine-rich CWC family protein [Anaerolineales bacterium]
MTSSANHGNNHPLSTSTCPLCGEPNQCAVAADPAATECWCELVDFPPELLAQIPDDAVRKTCVCQKCLIDYQESVNVAK